MDISLAINILLALIAVLSDLFAYQSKQTADSALLYQVLTNTLSEYRSPQMYAAVESLWWFARQYDTNLPKAYMVQRSKDAEYIKSLKAEDRLAFDQTTIHYHRRLVSQFYGLLASLELKHKSIVYMHWGESDLNIIPKVIIPIEEALSNELGLTDPENIIRLNRLYKDCPKRNA